MFLLLMHQQQKYIVFSAAVIKSFALPASKANFILSLLREKQND